ncbi:hypothetical protein GCM10023115_25000 [Pontixanthobacter gangjinensis]|uniref:GIY-YIG domain-containing protein n=1 Tax=Christiangramia aestuarii TaxID=1028746 RepID=A0A7K1LTU8_9FLAO|nr:GIY-YIG nuclease family protein [Christiangramia aestuarii]MUP43930.1 hypothetical protein [Christiangramia aestuarii]
MKPNRKYLYVLLCENEHYYIGQTNDLVKRFRQHKEQGDEGSVWTSNHKPIKIIQYWKIDQYSQEDAINFENRLTLEYINDYGYQKVRGGIYIFFDEEHHLGLLNSYNELVDGKFIPRKTEEQVQYFIKIRSKVLEYNLEQKKPYLYVLKLKNDKIYIGRSSTVLKSIRRHCYTNKSTWTSKFFPTDLLEIIEDQDKGNGHPRPFQNSIVYKYMRVYGWQNVRGGIYISNKENAIRKQLEKRKPVLLENYA